LVEGLKQLIELQDLDTELLAAETENERIPGRRAELAQRLETAQRECETARQALHDLETAQRRAETEVQDKQALLQKLEGQQFQVKTNEAYTALLHEMEHARDAVSDGETAILEAMEAIDAARQRLAAAEQQAAATAQGVAQQESALAAREAELAQGLARLREARAALSSQIAPDLLAQYARIASRRRPVLARVKGEMCLGCRVQIPPQHLIELLRGAKLITCLSCHRILIQEGGASAPK
jgi:predicted  nucleic acid-binding Zn-ribbon protein